LDSDAFRRWWKRYFKKEEDYLREHFEKYVTLNPEKSLASEAKRRAERCQERAEFRPSALSDWMERIVLEEAGPRRKQSELKEEALAKLTPDERAALGLSP
jgi:hypothetical protein